MNDHAWCAFHSCGLKSSNELYENKDYSIVDAINYGYNIVTNLSKSSLFFFFLGNFYTSTKLDKDFFDKILHYMWNYN